MSYIPTKKFLKTVAIRTPCVSRHKKQTQTNTKTLYREELKEPFFAIMEPTKYAITIPAIISFPEKSFSESPLCKEIQCGNPRCLSDEKNKQGTVYINNPLVRHLDQIVLCRGCEATRKFARKSISCIVLKPKAPAGLCTWCLSAEAILFKFNLSGFTSVHMCWPCAEEKVPSIASSLLPVSKKFVSNTLPLRAYFDIEAPEDNCDECCSSVDVSIYTNIVYPGTHNICKACMVRVTGDVIVAEVNTMSDDTACELCRRTPEYTWCISEQGSKFRLCNMCDDCLNKTVVSRKLRPYDEKSSPVSSKATGKNAQEEAPGIDYNRVLFKDDQQWKVRSTTLYSKVPEEGDCLGCKKRVTSGFSYKPFRSPAEEESDSNCEFYCKKDLPVHANADIYFRIRSMADTICSRCTSRRPGFKLDFGETKYSFLSRCLCKKCFKLFACTKKCQPRYLEYAKE